MPRKRAHNQKRTVGTGAYARLHQPIVHREAHRKAAIHEALTELGEVVYLIRCPDGLVKIGWTRELHNRRRRHNIDINAILAVTPGSLDDEQALHRRFQPHCAKGREYYRLAPEILDFINDIRTKAGVPPLAA